MLNWEEVMALFGAPDYTGKRTDPEIMEGILSLMDSPQEKLRIVHVAGTNGKGSACRMLQAILTESGYRTGLYISPHLEYMNERWSIDSSMISDEDIRQCAAKVREAVDQWNTNTLHKIGSLISSGSGSGTHAHAEQGITPTAFELLTMMAFVWFAQRHCDIVVLEVGIGGRTDATNIIPVPECALIMNIGLEHTEQLGHTLQEIAWQKGGIIKQDGDVVLYHQSDVVESVIKSICTDQKARLVITDPESLRLDSSSARLFAYRQHQNIALRLAGTFQRHNAMAVLDAVDLLRTKGWHIPESAVQKALSEVTWPGRFEIVSHSPLVIIDGAHNPNGVQALADAICDEQHSTEDGLLSGRKLIFVVGIMADKDIDSMLQILAPLATAFIMEAPRNERADDPDDLVNRVRRVFPGRIYSAASAGEALDLALSMIPPQDSRHYAVICCGSLFQIAELRRWCETALF